MKDIPLISCIMPTYNRRFFVPRAIEYFLRQDYPNRELIIVDDGSDPIFDLVSDDRCIHYLRRKDRLTIGAKRNLACEAAKGEIIAHWDDDDWIASWRLSYQVDRLLKDRADICGLNRVLFYDLECNLSWQYSYPQEGRAWICGGTFCYTKTFWHRNPFANTSLAEDTCFVWSEYPKKIVVLPDNSFYVAMIHSKNSNPKQTQNICWKSYPTTTIRELMGEDATFYANLGQHTNWY